MRDNPYDTAWEQGARALAIRIASRCRTLQRPVSISDMEMPTSNRTYDLLHYAEALGYLTVFKFRAMTAWGPVGWTFGPARRNR